MTVGRPGRDGARFAVRARQGGRSRAVTAEVLNIAGRPVQVLVADRQMAAATNTLTWNGRSATGVAVPSGIYLVRVRACDKNGARSEAVSTVCVRR